MSVCVIRGYKKMLDALELELQAIILGIEIRSSQHLSNSLGFNTIFLKNVKILLLYLANISCKYSVIKTKYSDHSRSGTCGMFSGQMEEF